MNSSTFTIDHKPLTMHESNSCRGSRVGCEKAVATPASRHSTINSQLFARLAAKIAFASDPAADLWPLTSGSAYPTLTSLQRKRYLFVCINRRAEDNPKGCCAAKDSEEVYRALKGEVAARGLAKLEARVCTSSCLDQCATGVTVLVEPDHFFYGRVTVADVPEIVDGLVKGQPVKRLVLTADQHAA
jgi:(2Fe-2S) ferredoxin